jgi:hydrogenase nickel incorporation protein HypA/HybF
MHEWGLSEAIVEATLRRAGDRPVAGVRVRVGGHPVDADVIAQGFALAAAGTPAAGAAVEVVAEPMTVRCRGCGREAPAADPLALLACPGCGGVDVELTGSDRVVLEWVRYRDPAPAGPPAAGALRRPPDPPGSPSGGVR